MHKNVTIIPGEHLISVNGKAYQCEIEDNTIHAIQWYEGKGHIEVAETMENILLSGQQDYEKHVKPYIELWERENNRKTEFQNRALTLEEIAEIEIYDLKNYLDETDYISNKIIDSGLLKAEFLKLPENAKYCEILEKRAQARARINELETD